MSIGLLVAALGISSIVVKKRTARTASLEMESAA
jgi:hypothetical protein